MKLTDEQLNKAVTLLTEMKGYHSCYRTEYHLALRKHHAMNEAIREALESHPNTICMKCGDPYVPVAPLEVWTICPKCKVPEPNAVAENHKTK